MRQTSLVFLALSTCLAAAPAGAANVWTPIGPEGGQILSVEADPRQASVLYAGTDQGVFKSTDGGTTWLRSSQGLRRRDIADLALAPSDSSVVYAGGAAGIFDSRDAGTTWSGPWVDFITSIAVDPRNPRRVWAGSGRGLYWRDYPDSPWNWVPSDQLIGSAIDVILDPSRPDTIYAATVRGNSSWGITGVVKSMDAGVTWVELRGVVEPFFFDAQLAVDPTAPNLVYASFRKPEGQVTWRSADGGATWQITDGGFPLAVDSRGVVYAGAMHSTDHGQTWQTGTQPPGIALRYAASADGTLWAGTDLGTFRSRDRAATWELAQRGLYASTVSSFVIDPEKPRVIYAAAERIGVSRTLSAGTAWQRVDADLPPDANDLHAWKTLALDPRQPQTVYLAWSAGGIARSDDGGAHWTVLRESDDNPRFAVKSLVVDPTASNIVYLVGSGVGAPGEPCSLARSTDRGATFRCVSPFKNEQSVSSAQKLVFDPARPGTLWVLVGRRDRLFKSTDRGATWTAVQLRGQSRAGIPRSLAFHPEDARRMFMGTTRVERAGDRLERIWRSDDGGVSWRPWGQGLPATTSVTQLLIDPQQPGILYAAVYDDEYAPYIADRSGVYWSRDGGKTFRPAGLSGNVLQLAQDPKNPRKLYASMEGRGIYTWTRP